MNPSEEGTHNSAKDFRLQDRTTKELKPAHCTPEEFMKRPSMTIAKLLKTLSRMSPPISSMKTLSLPKRATKDKSSDHED